MRIPVKSISDSGGRRSPIPLDADHLFRLMPIISRSEATLAVH